MNMSEARSSTVPLPKHRRLRRTAQAQLPPDKPRRPYIDPAIRHWLACFHQIHTEDDTYTPVALRLAADGSAQRSAEQTDGGRLVYEVALRRDARGERWVLIAWEVDVPGIQFCDCADRDEAMALFAEPAKAVGRWHGVRLRADSRPW